MHKLISAVLVGLGVLSFGAAPVQAQTLKVAFINSQRILAPEAAALEKKMEPFAARQKQMSDSATMLNDALTKDLPTLPAAVKEQRQRDFQTKYNAWQDEAQKMHDRADQMREDFLAPIMAALQKILTDIRAQEGYAFIYDLGAENAQGIVVVWDKNLDITDAVNAKYRATMVTATGAAGAAAGGAAGATPTKPPPAGAAGPVNNPAGIKPPPPTIPPAGPPSFD